MRIISIFIFSVVFLFSKFGFSANIISLPDTIGSNPALGMIEEQKTWNPQNMYEHVNGEAELLKRYGVRSLTNAAYENEGGDYLSVDILDMGSPVNAFGLYRLYAGCDGEEYRAHGATVLSGDFTSYAILGRHFMRIDFETEGGREEGKALVGEFLVTLSAVLSAPDPLPEVIERLEKLARKPCEVGYHPEHVDYDLETGPGYTWIGPNGGTYFARFLSSPDEAEIYAAALENRGASMVLVSKYIVSWSYDNKEQTRGYLQEAVKKLAP